MQVKTSRGVSWQFGKISLYCDIKFDGKRQVVGERKTCPVQRLIMVFVMLADYGNDRFYILPWEVLRDVLVDHHAVYLARNNGIRPRRWDSLHCAISAMDLEPYLDNWDAVEKNLR